MRRRGVGYASLDRLQSERHTVPWYWQSTAFIASWLILGGFLTLPVQFDSDAQLRISNSALAIFSVALLTAGFALTGLVCFEVRNWLFHADAVFVPALSSSAIGLLTLFYCFVVSSRYVWNTASLLTLIAAALSTFIYGSLLFWTYRRLAILKATHTTPVHIPLTQTAQPFAQTAYQSPHGPNADDAYHTNYVANAYPTAARRLDHEIQSPPAVPYDYTDHEARALPLRNAAIPTEDELTRQQMLMLLLNKPDPIPPPEPTPLPSSHNSSYRIDWADNDQEPPTAYPGRDRGQSFSHDYPGQTQVPDQGITPPYNGYYAPATTYQHPQIHAPAPRYPVSRLPPTVSVTPPSAGGYTSIDGMEAYHDGSGTGVGYGEVQSWTQSQGQSRHQRVPSGNRFSGTSAADREARRREIEMGM